MKKYLLIALTFFAFTAHAQHLSGDFGLMGKVGMAFSNITNDNEATWRTGLAVGIEGEYGLANDASLSFGAFYSWQGEKAKGVALTLDLDYVNVPILFNYYPIPGLAIKTGIQPGYMVKSKVRGYGNDFSLNDFDVSLNKFDFSIPIGLSYQIGSFIIDARYNCGLTNVVKGERSKNSVFQVTLGYDFHL